LKSQKKQFSGYKNNLSAYTHGFRFGLSSLSRLFFLQSHRINQRQREEGYQRLAAYYIAQARAVEDTVFSKLAWDISSYALVKAGDYEGAIEYYEHILRRHPCLRDSVYAVINAGFAYLDAELRNGGDRVQGFSPSGSDDIFGKDRSHSRISSTRGGRLSSQASRPLRSIQGNRQLTVSEGESSGTGQLFGNIESLKPISALSFGERVNTLLALLDDEDIGSETRDPSIPTEYFLAQSYPNPFNSKTTIKFGLPEAGMVKIEIYNVMGRKIATVVDKNLSAGYHSTLWDGRDFASGIYFYRIEAGSFIKTRKMMLLR